VSLTQGCYKRGGPPSSLVPHEASSYLLLFTYNARRIRLTKSTGWIDFSSGIRWVWILPSPRPMLICNCTCSCCFLFLSLHHWWSSLSLWCLILALYTGWSNHSDNYCRGRCDVKEVWA
jgi:hypothetical protein